MTPFEFISRAADSNYNATAGELQDALQVPLRIFSGVGKEWEILSYYFDPASQSMMLDIQPIN